MTSPLSSVNKRALLLLTRKKHISLEKPYVKKWQSFGDENFYAKMIRTEMRNFYLSNYLKPSLVVFNLKAKDKVQALEELQDVLAGQKLIKKKKLILTRIINPALLQARVDTAGQI